jgi:hypothetical protein
MAAKNLYRMKLRRGSFKMSLPEVAMIFEIIVDVGNLTPKISELTCQYGSFPSSIP